MQHFRAADPCSYCLGSHQLCQSPATYILPCRDPWLGVAWCGMAWHGMASHGMVWHGMEQHGSSKSPLHGNQQDLSPLWLKLERP